METAESTKPLLRPTHYVIKEDWKLGIEPGSQMQMQSIKRTNKNGQSGFFLSSPALTGTRFFWSTEECNTCTDIAYSMAITRPRSDCAGSNLGAAQQESYGLVVDPETNCSVRYM